MRVLHLFNSFQEGGTERQTVQLAKLLSAGGVEVHIGCQRRDGPLEQELTASGVRSIAVFPLQNLYGLNAAQQAVRFASHLRRCRIDVVHTHDFYTNTFGLPAAALARVPVRIGSKRELGLLTKARSQAERIAFRFASSVIANCDAVRVRLLASGLSPARVVTIPNGVTAERVAVRPGATRATVLAALGLSELADRRLIIMIANMREHGLKDHPTLLKAARTVLGAEPRVTFVLAGEGQLLSEMEALATVFGISSGVRFIGRQTHIGALLHIADVCVLSSRSEGLPNALLEYMAASKPVVATDVGGVSEALVAGETGFLVGPGDSAAMAEAILQLLGDPALARRMGEAGRTRVEAGFAVRLQLQRTLDLYTDLLDRRHRDPAFPFARERGMPAESHHVPKVGSAAVEANSP